MYQTVSVPLPGVLLEDGTVMAKQATTATGFAQLSDKDLAIMVPTNGTSKAWSFQVALPEQLDSSRNILVDVFASKDADNDALTLDLEAYLSKAGDVGNAESHAGSAQTVVAAGSWLTFPLTANLLSGPACLNGVLTLGGTNDGDVFYIRAVKVRFPIL